MKKCLIVFGTRPELIKLSPVLKEIKQRNLDRYFTLLCTNQHRELLLEVYEAFDLSPDIVLLTENKNRSLGNYLLALEEELHNFIREHTAEFDWVMGQGDTSSCFIAAKVAARNQLNFAHVEAGLRSYSLEQPFPEEYFRQLISQSARIHFTPTDQSTKNLISEGYEPSTIVQTGNTIIDVVEHWKSTQITVPPTQKDTVLITCHRRENQNDGFNAVVRAVTQLAMEYPNLHFLWVAHCAPFVQNQLRLSSLHQIKNIAIVPPLSILHLFEVYQTTRVIITDSGGIQEEATAFSIPTIVLREKTERMEAVNMGNAILTGTDRTKIVRAFSKFMSAHTCSNDRLFGNGDASVRILDYFELIIQSPLPVVEVPHFSRAENRLMH